jgi:hypothetical protein
MSEPILRELLDLGDDVLESPPGAPSAAELIEQEFCLMPNSVGLDEEAFARWADRMGHTPAAERLTVATELFRVAAKWQRLLTDAADDVVWQLSVLAAVALGELSAVQAVRQNSVGGATPSARPPAKVRPAATTNEGAGVAHVRPIGLGPTRAANTLPLERKRRSPFAK